MPAAASAAPQLASIGGSFTKPVHVTGAPGDYSRLYVTEQPGTIKVVRNGSPQTFLDLTALVRSTEDTGEGAEEGLLSVAFAPDFVQSRRFYVYYTGLDEDVHVDEFRAPTADRADPATRRPVITIDHPFTNHNGGQLQFGRDGMLYLAPGDGGSGNDPAGNAQNLEVLLGKILRINPRVAGPGYAVPADNPYVGRPGRDEIWSYGLRNPYRFSFDRLTGDLTVGDVGQDTTEEIDYVPASQGAGRGANFGWDVCEGSFIANTNDMACSLSTSRLPVIDAFQPQWIAIIGGYVVRDPSLPSLRGRYIYSDYGKSELWSARLALPMAQDVGFTGLEIPGTSSFGEDAAGCLYVTQLGGEVSRIVENDARIPCPAGAVPISQEGNPDGSPPRLRTRVKRRQRVLRLGGAVAYARCDEACSVAAGGKLRIGRRRYAMRRATASAAQAGSRRRLKVKLTRRGTRALRRALRRGNKASVRLTIRARDRAGNRSALITRIVRVRR